MDIIQEICSALMFAFFALAGVVGVVALTSPKWFAAVAEVGGMSLTSNDSKPLFHSPVEIDSFIIRHSRKFGALVILVVGFLTLLFLGQIDPSLMPAFLLLVSGLSVFFVYTGLMELGSEVSKIENQLADARIDPLTALANRRAFDEELERRCSETSRTGAPFCVALIDVDQFKTVNDTFGHLAGDSVLVNGVAAVLQARKRMMDLAARYGGDEFAVIYPVTDLESACKAAENLRNAVSSEPLALEDSEFRVTLSIGVAESQDCDDAKSIICRADQALYAAKLAGRNRVGCHNGVRCEVVTTGDALAESPILA